MASQNECQTHIYIMDILLDAMGDVDKKWVDSHSQQLETQLMHFQQLGGSLSM